MDGLYPNLEERFKSEGLCQICLMEMELTPRYSCENAHTICHRCKPYYYSCPTCRSPMNIQIPPQYTAPYPPPTTHFMPHPMPPQFHSQYPSAPPMDDFIAHERHAWSPPPPTEDQDLQPCSYTHLGCWVKVPIYLQDLHESRCQFRPNLEEEQLPTDLNRNEDELVECAFTVAGCRVRTTPWRLSIHQNYCIYKDKYDEMTNINMGLESVTITSYDPDDDGDPEELVECRYRSYGCMVKMPRRRKYTHEQKCNYNKYCEARYEPDVPDEPDTDEPNDYYGDPEEIVECKYRSYGCMVKMPRKRKYTHEEKCNYNKYCEARYEPVVPDYPDTDEPNDYYGDPEEIVECRYRIHGCMVKMPRKRKYTHEEKCNYNKYCEAWYEPLDPNESDTDQTEDCYGDPDEQVPCRWEIYGCAVQPKRYRKKTHEEKCYYKMVRCSYKDNGCYTLFPPARRYAHERTCKYAN